MSSIFLIAAMAALVYIIYWMIRNDRAESIADQTGLLRMRVTPKNTAQEQEGKSKSGRHRPNASKTHDLRPGAMDAEGPPDAVHGDPADAGMDETSELLHPVMRHHARRRRSGRHDH